MTNGGAVSLLKGKSLFDVDPPGNTCSQPCPVHDIVTQMVTKKMAV